MFISILAILYTLQCGHRVNGINVQGITVNNTLMLGYLLPWEREWLVPQTIGSAIIVGIEEVYKRQLLPGYEIDWTWRDTYCNPKRGMASNLFW